MLQLCLYYNLEKESYCSVKSVVANTSWNYIEIDLIGSLLMLKRNTTIF
jgi:hypothetical protein